MKLIFDIGKMRENIMNARRLVNTPVALMFKDFYDHLANRIDSDARIYGKHLAGSICYAIGQSSTVNTGAFVLSAEQAVLISNDYGTRRFCIPIDTGDGREGLCPSDAERVGSIIKDSIEKAEVIGIVTAGCMNANAPTVKDLTAIWSIVCSSIDYLSVGGSYWLDKVTLFPHFVREVRIGEYMLFGTIPYPKRYECFGKNAVTMNTYVLGVFPERKELIIDVGYSMADMSKCTLLDHHPELEYVDTSSEYTIFRTDRIEDYWVGQRLVFRPDYYSMVKLKNAYVEYIR